MHLRFVLICVRNTKKMYQQNDRANFVSLLMKMSKKPITITEAHVLKFVAVAPVDILKRVGIAINKRLQEDREKDSQTAVMRAIQKNRNRSIATDDGDEGPPEPSTAGSKLIGILQGIKVTDHEQLTEQLDVMSADADFEMKDQEANLVFMYKDNYGNGHFKINDDEELEAKLCTMRDHCAGRDNMYSCFGYGKNKDLLRIKNFSNFNKGDRIVIALKISHWSRDGRSGFSCYKV